MSAEATVAYIVFALLFGLAVWLIAKWSLTDWGCGKDDRDEHHQ